MGVHRVLKPIHSLCGKTTDLGVVTLATCFFLGCIYLSVKTASQGFKYFWMVAAGMALGVILIRIIEED